MSTEQERLSQHCQDALIAGVVEPPDTDMRERALDAILSAGPRSIFAALCGWSYGCWINEESPDGPGEFWGLEAEDPAGGAVNPDALVHDDGDWGALAAVRFVVAHRNGDWDTMRALFESAPSPEGAGSLVANVLQLATQQAREFVANKRGNSR